MKSSCFILLLAAFAPAFADTPFAVNPYTYLGRVMDAEHVAFDTNRIATLSAYRADGTLLARTTSTFRPSSRNNYRLDIPVASPAVSGTAGVGDVLAVSAVDDNGTTWAGVVVDPGRADGTVVGEPGGVREVDIVLGRDADGDGLDDALVDQIRAAWEDWRAWQDDADPNEEFDLSKDHDGDGVSTRDEIIAGTDPFSAENALRITAFDRETPDGATRRGGAAAEDAGFSLSFSAVGGHAYSLLRATSLEGPWEAVEFRTSPGATPVNVISYPNSSGTIRPTVYLAPLDAPAAFFKVRCE